MADSANFDNVFKILKPILQKYQSNLRVEVDTPENYSLNTPFWEKYRKEVFFGAVQIKKNYVSFHLMPVYMYPDLLDGISPKLKKRMQGKSCFNFTSIDEETVNELNALAQKGIERIQKERET